MLLRWLQVATVAGVVLFTAVASRGETWKYIAPVQKAAWEHKIFESGTWGGEIRSEFKPQPGEIVAQEHWGSSGFANTDLDLQLKKHGIDKLIVIGLIAHTCVRGLWTISGEIRAARPPGAFRHEFIWADASPGY